MVKSVATITLGQKAEVLSMFAFPNNVSGNNFLVMSIDDTLKKYLNDTFRREGTDIHCNNLVLAGDVYTMTIEGSNAENYVAPIEAFMAAGLLGLQACINLDKVAGTWQGKWRFYLPLGLAMKNNYCVELLHFPPDYTIEEDQDYLLANTLIRWGHCLEVNGVASDDVDRFQTTVDIYPIGADSGDGKDIDAAIENKEFTPYTNMLLKQWTSSPSGMAKPLVIFGGTVRRWFEEQFETGDLSVGDSGFVDIEGISTPYNVANHPSYFYNAIDESLTPEENYPHIQPIMQDDLITAFWQVLMKDDPALDPIETYIVAEAYYLTVEGQEKICRQVFIQGFGYSEEAAIDACLTPPVLSTTEREAMRETLYNKLDLVGNYEGRETLRLRMFARSKKATH